MEMLISVSIEFKRYNCSDNLVSEIDRLYGIHMYTTGPPYCLSEILPGSHIDSAYVAQLRHTDRQTHHTIAYPLDISTYTAQE